jgi:hypothetical protein
VSEPTATAASPTTEPTVNSDRLPLYKVSAGRILRGATVRILSTDDAIPAKARCLVEEVTDRRWGQDAPALPRQATVRFTHLERTFRTSEEQELGRDFTPEEEERASEQRCELRFAVLADERSRTEIAETIAQIATRLERAAEDLRRELQSPADPAQQAERAQHAVAWLFPNLGADHLTRSAIEWSMSKTKVTRLLTRPSRHPPQVPRARGRAARARLSSCMYPHRNPPRALPSSPMPSSRWHSPGTGLYWAPCRTCRVS